MAGDKNNDSFLGPDIENTTIKSKEQVKDAGYPKLRLYHLW